MFAVVRTGGKQYRVAEGDKIAVEKLAGEAGETIRLGDVLLAGDGGELADAGKVMVSAEIIAQAKSEKVVVFKKRRRHNYRRKNGHRQQMTLLRIVAVGEEGKAPVKRETAAPQAEAGRSEADQVEAVQGGAVQADTVQADTVQEGAKPTEPAKGIDTQMDDQAQKAEPLKDHAESKPADDNSGNA